MKWILIASVLNWQPVYDDQKTCQLAAEELRKVYYQEVAACIPKPVGNAGDDRMNSMFDRFMDMVQELQAIEQTEVDNSSN